jgi:outer membrane protein insertion porin family
LQKLRRRPLPLCGALFLTVGVSIYSQAASTDTAQTSVSASTAPVSNSTLSLDNDFLEPSGSTAPPLGSVAARAASTTTYESRPSTAPALGSLALPSPSTTTYGLQTSSAATVNIEGEKKISRFAKVSKIHVSGNKNIRERVILTQVKTKQGDLYDPDRLRKDVQSVYTLGDFDDVNVDVDETPAGVVVVFQVVEKPIIKRIEFKGNKKISRGKLTDTATLKENDPLDKLKLNTDVDKILSLYKDEGFAAAEVEPYTTADATNHVTVTFFIKEGIQVLVQQVIVRGVHAFPEPKVRKLMKTRKKKVFKQDQLVKDLDEMRKFYKNRGYQNVKVSDAQQEFNADKTRLTLTIDIDEGPLFHFGATSFSGNAIFQTSKLVPALQYKKGEVYSQDKMDATLARLKDVYGEQGYIRVQVNPTFKQDTDHGIVDPDFEVTEGEVVYVDHIGVEGNTHTKEFVIRREIQLKEGDAFSSVKARKSVERLYNLGFLDNVDIDVQQPNAPNKADVIFTVQEGKPGVLSAGAGYSSVDGLIGTFQVQHINFLGRGQRLNLLWEFGARRNSLDLGWTDPWFLGKPLTFGVDIFNVIRTMQLGTDITAYTTRDRGASITAGPRFSDIYNLLFTYSFSNTLRYDVDPNLDFNSRALILNNANCANDPNCTEVTLIKSNLTQQFIRDGRDNQFDPQRGSRESASVTEGGLFPANAIHFIKPVLDYSVHFPTFWKFVLSLHGQWAEVKPYGQSGEGDIVDELFRVGGSDTVRGYELGSVGVLQGGQVMNVYNIEYKFPIAPDEHGKTLLQGVLFYDVGGSWNSLGDINYRITSQHTGLKQGVGFGIRFKTPVFPLRLDWGHALNPDPGEAHSQFYFNVGSLF